MNHTVAFAFSVTWCFGLAAQQADLGAPEATGLATAQGVFECDGHLVALGANYKAWFRDGEVEFIPAFGRTAPRNVPLRLRATGMARGAAVVPFVSVPAQRHGAEAVRFARAPGVTEIFAAQERGLEQSFVFTDRPAGSGDLVVTCALLCECESVADGQGGLRFTAPDVGTFSVGAVTGIDAAGERVRGALQRTGNSLTMSLPAQFVDRASYPIVLDPLLGGPTLVSGLDRVDPDVVFDPGTGDWLAVWGHFVSSTECDIYGQRIAQASGSPVGGVFPIDVTTNHTVTPRAGSVRSAGRVLVVYRRPTVTIFTAAHEGRTIALATATVSPPATISTSGSENFAVASEDTTYDNEALVVWGTGTDVMAAQVTVYASGAPVPANPVSIVTGLNDPRCSISKTNGGTGNYLIAWRTSPVLPGGTTLYGILVSRNLVVMTPSHTLEPSANGTPAIDCNGSRYLVAYSKREAGLQTYDVHCVSVAYLAAFGALIVIDGPSPVEATVGQDEWGADVAWLGQRYCVTCTEDGGTTTENAIAWLVSTDCTKCNARMTLSGVNLTPTYTLERDARVAGRAHFVAGAIDGQIVYTEDQTNTPHPIVVGQRVVSHGPGGAVANFGGGCGQGGAATATPNGFAIGNPGCQFAVSGLAPGALPLCALGVPAATIPCGTCTFVNPLATFFEPNVAGAASHLFVVPCDPSYIGFQMDVQWVSVLTPVSPCPLVSGLSASNRVRFTLGS